MGLLWIKVWTNVYEVVNNYSRRPGQPKPYMNLCPGDCNDRVLETCRDGAATGHTYGKERVPQVFPTRAGQPGPLGPCPPTLHATLICRMKRSEVNKLNWFLANSVQGQSRPRYGKRKAKLKRSRMLWLLPGLHIFNYWTESYFVTGSEWIGFYYPRMSHEPFGLDFSQMS